MAHPTFGAGYWMLTASSRVMALVKTIAFGAMLASLYLPLVETPGWIQHRGEYLSFTYRAPIFNALCVLAVVNGLSLIYLPNWAWIPGTLWIVAIAGLFMAYAFGARAVPDGWVAAFGSGALVILVSRLDRQQRQRDAAA